MEFAKYFTVGAISFWAPVTFMLALGYDFARVPIGSVIAPALVILGWRVLGEMRKRKDEGRSALFMLLGIWAAGPPALALAQLRYGGGLFNEDFWGLWAMFPITTWVLSAYAGCIAGLVIASGYLLWQTARAWKSPSNHSLDRPAAQ